MQHQRIDSDGFCWIEYQSPECGRVCKGIAVLNYGKGREIERSSIEQVSEFFSNRFGIEIEGVVVPVQVHGNSVVFIDSYESVIDLQCDGLVTEREGLALGVTTADCIPLIAHDVEGRIVGIAHCGWRGIAAGIVERLVDVLAQRGFKPKDSVFLIGPSIGACCYEVGEDLLRNFQADEVRNFSFSKGGRKFVDLRAIVASRLRGKGVSEERTWIDPICTSCSSDYLPSYRASGGNCGRMLALVALKSR
ncbi:MAG: peptidoglycan editing factor PgeF [bacterium]